MNRRTLLLSGAALSMLPLAAMAEMVDYTPGAAEAQIAAGETILLDFSATWCSTCRSQGRTIDALRDADPAYDAAIAFYRVDWDEYGGSELAEAYSVPRRSTLILIRDGAEVARIVAGTREEDIRGLLDLGLN